MDYVSSRLRSHIYTPIQQYNSMQDFPVAGRGRDSPAIPERGSMRLLRLIVKLSQSFAASEVARRLPRRSSAVGVHVKLCLILAIAESQPDRSSLTIQLKDDGDAMGGRKAALPTLSSKMTRISLRRWPSEKLASRKQKYRSAIQQAQLGSSLKSRRSSCSKH